MNFGKLFGKKDGSKAEHVADAPLECLHVMLTPRWDSVADIGHEDKAVGYKCTACGTSLTLEEGHEAQRRHIQPVA